MSSVPYGELATVVMGSMGSVSPEPVVFSQPGVAECKCLYLESSVGSLGQPVVATISVHRWCLGLGIGGWCAALLMQVCSGLVRSRTG